MIKLDNVTMHDFLNRRMVQELLDVGVDMSDATYYIATSMQGEDYVFYGNSDDILEIHNPVPTYTVSQLHFKLHEWIYPTIEGKQYSGGLSYFKDAPFYIFYYDLKHKVLDEKGNVIKIIKKDNYISAEGGTPIESLAYLLKQCHLKDVGYKTESGKPFPDAGNIRSKYDDFIWNLK